MVPVLTGTLGVIPKNLGKYLENMQIEKKFHL